MGDAPLRRFCGVAFACPYQTCRPRTHTQHWHAHTDMGTADTLYKLTTAGLGVATILTGGWLGLNMWAGFDYHRKHPQAQLGQNLDSSAAEAEKA